MEGDGYHYYRYHVVSRYHGKYRNVCFEPASPKVKYSVFVFLKEVDK